VFAYSHAGLFGSVAITGGLVVRDPALGSLTGRYLYADFYAGVIHSLQLATPSALGDRVETDLPTVPNLVSFGEDADAHVYVVSLAGSVQRLGCDGCPAPGGGGTSDATSPGGSSPAATAPAAAPQLRDTTAPRLRLRADRTQAVLQRGVVRLSVSCDESCIVRVSGSARGVKLRGLLERLTPGKRVGLELRASKRVRRALARHGVVVIRVRARDGAGNLSTATLTVRVKRR
jgi:hypothetical protein